MVAAVVTAEAPTCCIRTWCARSRSGLKLLETGSTAAIASTLYMYYYKYMYRYKYTVRNSTHATAVAVVIA